MLTVNPAKRANVTDVAAHWWTNKDSPSSLHTELCRVSMSSSNRRTSDYFEDDNVFCELSKEEKIKPERIVTPVFDSSKKPKKSILKKRNISSSDSGCALSDCKYNSELSSGVSSGDSTTSEEGTSLRRRTESELASSSDIKTHTKQRSISLLTPTVRRTSPRKDSLSSCSSTELLDFSYDSQSESGTDTNPQAILELL